MLKVKSVFRNNSKIPVKYTIDGRGVSPPLAISNIPMESRNLTIFIYDPDANNFVHLNEVVPLTSSIPEGYFKKYIPMSPPEGTHEYIFRVVATGIYGRKVDEGVLVGKYKRGKKK